MGTYPKNYLDYLILFHCDRDYFECHEVLEAEWKKKPKGERHQYWVGLIQLAVSLYHHRRKNWIGAEKMIEKASRNLLPYHDALSDLGLDYLSICKIVKLLKRRIKRRENYESIDLPLTDQSLIQYCRAICHENDKTWGKASDLTNQYLINKHKARRRN